ncbi:hypothetical protein TNIN_159441 [Trichonephila inaurata madagascariensis]|uniref:Uncharacterized protein n=1 Tax=Trichonephila inaurata madagascariensis TaxID=2747483 RepID=A0A8X7BX93_9ARAC|nr:hypothetical protein TNIN_159441 [Trichonephila inaurata madagascariensis]
MASKTIIFSIAISFAVLLQCAIAANQQEDVPNAINGAAETIQNAIMKAANEVAKDGLDDGANIIGQKLLDLGSRIANEIEEAGNTVVRDGLDVGADEIAAAMESGADEIANAIHGWFLLYSSHCPQMVQRCNFREKMSTTPSKQYSSKDIVLFENGTPK